MGEKGNNRSGLLRPYQGPVGTPQCAWTSFLQVGLLPEAPPTGTAGPRCPKRNSAFPPANLFILLGASTHWEASSLGQLPQTNNEAAHKAPPPPLSAWHSNNGHVLSALPPCHLWNWLLWPHPEEPLPPCQVWTAADKASGDPQPSVSAQPCSAVDTPVSGLHAFEHAVPPSLHVLPSSTAARKRLLSPVPSMSQGVPDEAELGE